MKIKDELRTHFKVKEKLREISCRKKAEYKTFGNEFKYITTSDKFGYKKILNVGYSKLILNVKIKQII